MSRVNEAEVGHTDTTKHVQHDTQLIRLLTVQPDFGEKVQKFIEQVQ